MLDVQPKDSHKIIEEGFNSRDTEKVLSRYADHAVLVLPSGDRISGKKLIGEYLETVLTVIASATIELVSIVEAGGIALELTRSTAVLSDPEQGAPLQGTSTVVMQQIDGLWSIIIDVMSE